MADQPGQGGLVDLGTTGDTPLHHVTLGEKPDWTRGGVPAVPGHTYAALASDGQSVIVFRIEKMGDDAVLTFIVWRPEKAITGQCKGVPKKPPSQPSTTCACKGADMVCSNGQVSKGDKRCAQPNVTCGCEGTTLVCSDGQKYDKDPQCDVLCGCEGADMVCRDQNKNVTSTSKSDTQCATGVVCGCEGDNMVCRDSNKNQISSQLDPACIGPAPFCGDGNVDPGEGCDPPDGSTCDSKCQPIYTQAPYCGDGNVDPGESCDPPDGSTCDSKCQPIYNKGPVCGNGVVEKGEACEYDSDCGTSGWTCVSCGCAPP
jgi:hypothetical protein